EFQQSMELWLKKATDQAMVLPDLDMQRSGLRASRLLLKKGQLVVDFDIPVVRIVNNTEEPQTYQTKGPYSDWSTNWVLKPGKAHHFTVPFPMLYRRSEGGIEELYTLPLGADVEFRWDAENTSEKPVARLFLKSSRPKSEESNSQDQFSTSAVE
ncbi:MAG: hypothetical protein KDA65_18830, partial [Planctomycetaceae bacterium]|nr:hypothetical protein [Planctomycetaceae bacterium]